MRILNIYGQAFYHQDARIIGNEEGLTHLRDVIDNALETKRKQNTWGEPLFASDGEGYTVTVECHDDDSGIKGSVDSFWNKKESRPEYTSLQGM